MECNQWCHLNCSRLKSVNGVQFFSVQFAKEGNNNEKMTVGRRIVEVHEFCFVTLEKFWTVRLELREQ